MNPRLACLPFVLALAACSTVGPPYQTPEGPLPPAQWKNAALLANNAGQDTPTSLASWWQSLDDPVLDQLITMALERNPDLRSARARLRQARARARIADSSLYPAISGNTSARRSESGRDANPTESYSAGFDASWEADLFGANRSASQAAAATVSAQEATLRDTRVSLMAEVASLYISLRTQEALHAVARDNLASQQETRNLTRWRWQAGLVSELDFLQAESTLAQIRARLPLLDTELESTRNQLAVLLGVQPAALPDLQAGTGRIPDFSRIAHLPVPLDTLRQRPDVRAAERNLAAQAAEIGVAEAARYPSLTLSGSFSLQSGELGQLLRADSLLNSLAASLSSPVFNAGRIRANIDLQNALFDQLLATYEKTVMQALADVENALMALANSEARRAELQIASASANEAYALARHRYATGLSDYLTVLETHRTRLSTGDALKSVEGERIKALVQLYKALGGGWEDSEHIAATSRRDPK